MADDGVLEHHRTFLRMPWQKAFIDSEVRFPSLVAGWGTGKSLCLIAKALKSAKEHPDNLILIMRYAFTDLRDSTMKDFYAYTGIPIPANKDVTFSNGSTIMFRHGSELSTLQNINLGAALIEQGEEFDSAGEFDFLRGRLRRAGCPHYLAVIANANGHNWVWSRWERPNPNRNREYQQWYATTFDNAKNLPADFIDDCRKMEQESPSKFKRLVMNSRKELDIEGAYYVPLMNTARAEGRIGSVPHDPAARVYTFWDIGFTDATGIWCAQFVQQQVRLIEYYENSGEPVAHYIKQLQNRSYVYAESMPHWMPHDSKARDFKTGKSLLDIARGLGLKGVQALQPYNREYGIDLVRGILSRCWFDEEKCARGIEALEHYRRNKNKSLTTENHSVFSDSPLHDWASHGADSFRYMATVYREKLVIDGGRPGVPNPTVWYPEESESSFDDIRHGMMARS